MNEKRRLKNRKNLSTAIKTELLDALKALSIKENIAMSKLLDQAIEEFLNRQKNNPSAK